MRYAGTVFLTLVVTAAGMTAQGATPPNTGHRAQDGSRAPEDYPGLWSGSWEGPTSGEFDLTIEKGSDAAPRGKISVTAGSPPYTAEFKSLSVDGGKLIGRYDYPLDEGGEVFMEATFDGGKAKGTWVLRPQGQPQEEMARGTFVLTRKQR